MHPPEILRRPVRTGTVSSQVEEPTGFIAPTLDGEVTHYYEWQNAGSFDCLKSGGAMHRVSHTVKAIFFGFNQEMMFFRIDTLSPLQKLADDIRIELELVEPSQYKLSISKTGAELLRLTEDGTRWGKMPDEIHFSSSKVLELGFPIKALDFSLANSVAFQLSVKEAEQELERWPQVDLIRFKLPLDKSKPIFWGV